MKKKKWQDALNSFNRALDLIPDEPEAIEMGDNNKLDEIAAELKSKLKKMLSVPKKKRRLRKGCRGSGTTSEVDAAHEAEARSRKHRMSVKLNERT